MENTKHIGRQDGKSLQRLKAIENELKSNPSKGEVEHPGAATAVNATLPFNVLNITSNQEPTPIKAFEEEGDVFEGKSREELIEDLGKTGVESEVVKGTVVEDAVTGERLPGIAKDMEQVESLQQLEPEQIKRHLVNIVKNNLTILIPEDLTDEDADAIVSSLEAKLLNMTMKDIKAMDHMQVKSFYGPDVYNQIKKFNPTSYTKLAKKLLVDFKDGIVEYEGVVDSMEEVNKHMKFFEDINLDKVRDDINTTLDGEAEVYPTEFHKYKKYLEMYLEYLDSRTEYADNAFMEKEKELTKDKLKAVSEAMEFKYIYSKCENGKDKLLKDFRNTEILNKTIFDFVGKLYNDPTVNIAFPMPKNFNKKTDASKILTSVWISFLEMSIIIGQFPAVRTLSSGEYVEMTQILRGEIKKQSEKEDEVVVVEKIDINQFIDDNDIKLSQIVEARKAAIAICYIIARAFKPTVINRSQYMKYVLSYTMNILTQSMNNDGCNKMLLELMVNLRTRLT